MIAGEWRRTHLMGREMSGKRSGLVGFGSIARKVAARAMALGMSVSLLTRIWRLMILPGRIVRTATLADLAADCDVISIHVPLTEETRHLIGVEFIRSMRAGSILINTARGGVVDESALVEALREGRLGGAALDVFQSEPLQKKRCSICRSAERVDDAAYCRDYEEANQRVSLVTAQNVLKHL